MLGVAISTVDGRLRISLLSAVGLDDLGDLVADLQRHFKLGAGKTLRRILEAKSFAMPALAAMSVIIFARVGGDLLDAGDVLVEHDAALQLARWNCTKCTIGVFAPSKASKVRVISSGRHCTSTCRRRRRPARCPARCTQRAKSKSVCEADGKPISISLKPMSSRSWNMRALRSWPIGSISAWLPSRRSTEHQIGALVDASWTARCGLAWSTSG